MATGYEKISVIKSKLTKPMTVAQLAEAMGCGPRTIFRHLEFLMKENCGLRRYKDKAAGETFYVIQSEEKQNFNQDIVKQLEKLKKTFSETSPSDVKSRKVVDKVVNMLQTTDPDDFKAEAVTLDQNYILDYGPFCDSHMADTFVNNILKAIRNRFMVKLNYRSSANGESKVIVVRPVKVIMRIDTLYLVAADDTFEETQTFKNYMFENIISFSISTRSFAKIDFDAGLHYKYAFGKYTTMEKPEDVSLLVKRESCWLQTQFKKSSFNPPADCRMNKDGSMVVNLKVRLTPDFKSWLMGMSSDVRILKPVSLKNEIVEMLKKALDSALEN